MSDDGLKVVPLTPAQFAFFSYIFDGNIDPDNAFGLALVTPNYLPVAVGGAFWDHGKCFVFLHLGQNGKWFKANPTRILKAMKQVKASLVEIGVEDLYLEADLRVANSIRLIEWAGGRPTGEHGNFGPIYLLKLSDLKKI